MASKQHWREYFKLMNDREPSLEEFQQAILNGDIDDVQTAPAEAGVAENVAAAQAAIPTKSEATASNSALNQSMPQQTAQPQSVQPQPAAPEALKPFPPRPENRAKPTSEHQVGLWEAYKLFWKNYVNFTGRSRRSEFWWVVLINSVIAFLLFIPGFIVMLVNIIQQFSAYGRLSFELGSPTYMPTSLAMIVVSSLLSFLPLTLFSLAVLIPTWALVFRRLRDAGLQTLNAVAFVIFMVVIDLLRLVPYVKIISALAGLALAIYLIVIYVRRADYYQNRPEPITDWFVKLFKN